MIRNSRASYGSLSKLIHWIVAFAIITMITVGFSMHTFTEPLKSQIYGFHEELGLTILAIMLFRLYWRLVNPVPKLPQSMPTLQRAASHIGHWLIYLTVFTMILSGWAKSTSSGYIPSFYGLFDLPMPFITQSLEIKKIAKSIHLTTNWILISLLSIHILAALHHHFICKDNILTRMLPSRNRNNHNIPNCDDKSHNVMSVDAHCATLHHDAK